MGIGAAVAGAAIVGTVATAYSSSQAASAQKSSANAAQKSQDAATAYNEANQQPFIDAGTAALDTQQAQINNYQNAIAGPQQAAANAVPKSMTEANLVQTPGYQFNLSQGLESTQNAAAARGLGVSGAALKGAASYATGLADNTYQNQFANQQTQFADYNANLSNALAVNNQAFNQNASRIQVGANASTQAGTQAQAGAANSGAISVGLGNALGASSIATGNAISSGVNTAANAYNQQNALAAYNAGGSVYSSAARGGNAAA